MGKQWHFFSLFLFLLLHLIKMSLFSCSTTIEDSCSVQEVNNRTTSSCQSWITCRCRVFQRHLAESGSLELGQHKALFWQTEHNISIEHDIWQASPPTMYFNVSNVNVKVVSERAIETNFPFAFSSKSSVSYIDHLSCNNKIKHLKGFLKIKIKTIF